MTSLAGPSSYSVSSIASLTFSSLSTSAPSTSTHSTSIQSTISSSSSHVRVTSSSLPTATATSRSRTTDTSSSSSPSTVVTLTSETTSGTTSGSTTLPSASSIPQYVQLVGYYGSAKAVVIPENFVVDADYNNLCPGGDCFAACQNYTRLFEALPDGIDEHISTYGKNNDITLFGICSNLGMVSDLAHTSDANRNFASYFPTSSEAAAIHNVTESTSLCFVETCQKTRDPLQCVNECSLDSIQSGDSLSITGMYRCLARLCLGSCGLPYANQDVYGVGLLVSYITQGALVLILAAVLIVSATWRFLVQRNTSRPELSKKLRESMETFLVAQCYFGISAAIASYFMHPSTVDPLNGYALLSVAVTGFIPTTFTLLLLHSHGIKSWYTTLMTFVSWLFSTILFFLLVRNLSNVASNPRAIDRGLNSLFEADSCGKSSAMSLCQQTFDSDPLQSLSWFYNYQSIPSVKTVPLLWVLSTVVLLCLTVLQILNWLKPRQHNRSIHVWTRLGSLYIGSILFSLALAYQARMVVAYTAMDVIDWDGWTFGQVVALLFWVPALLDCFRLYAKKTREARKANKAGGYSKIAGTPSLPQQFPPKAAVSQTSPVSPRPSVTPTSPAPRSPISQSSLAPASPVSQRSTVSSHMSGAIQASRYSGTPSLEPLRAQNASRPPSQTIELAQIPRRPVGSTRRA